MKSQNQTVAIIAVLLTLAFTSSYAAVPGIINFQAQITDSLGNPINDTVDITFKIYTGPTEPVEEWMELHSSVPIETEIVHLHLASVTPFPSNLYENDELWLGITVGTDPEISPRSRLVSVPFSARAEGVDGHFLTSPGTLIIPAPGGPDTAVIIDETGIVLSTTAKAIAEIIVQKKSSNEDVRVSHSDITITKTMDAPSIKLFNSCCDGEILMGPAVLTCRKASEPLEYIEISFDKIVSSDNLGNGAELSRDGIVFTQSSGVDSGCIVNYNGLEVRGGSVDLLSGTDLTVTGTLDLTGGTLDLSGSDLTVGGHVVVGSTLTVNDGGTFTNGGTLTFDGPSSGILTMDENGVVSSLGFITAIDAGGPITLTTTVEPSGLSISGDGTVTLDAATINYSDGTDDITIERVGKSLEINTPLIAGEGLSIGGMISFENPNLIAISSPTELRLESGSFADYIGATGNITITGDDLRLQGSDLVIGQGGSLVCSSGAVFTDGLQFDADNDLVVDITITDTPTPTLNLLASATLDCDGPADFSGLSNWNSVTVSGTQTNDGPAVFNNTVTLSGTADFHVQSPAGYFNGVSFDPTNDASPALDIDAAPTDRILIYDGVKVENHGDVVCELDGSYKILCEASCHNTFTIDPDNDAIADVLIEDLAGTPTLTMTASTDFLCEGNANFGRVDIDVNNDAIIDCQFHDVAGNPTVTLDVGTDFVAMGPTTINQLECPGSANFSGTVTAVTPTFSWDPNNDATNDVVIEDLVGTPTLTIELGTEFRCGGPAEFTNTSTWNDVTITGTNACNDMATIDVNNDAIIDVAIQDLAGNPTVTFDAGVNFDCLAPSTFDQPVQMISDLTVNGALTVHGPKAFAQEHPENESKEIVSVALEGNEAGTYTRGSSQLVYGVAEIELPEDFRFVTNEEGLTVQITPRGPVQSMLYVESITPTKLVVKASNEIDSNVKFDFLINGVRKGFEDHQVIRDKKSYVSR